MRAVVLTRPSRRVTRLTVPYDVGLAPATRAKVAAFATGPA